MDFQRIEPRKLYLKIADQILERVRDGRLLPGRKLPAERELAAQMGVSRPSIREAMIALELLGIVEIRIGQGTYVVRRPMSLESLGTSELVSPMALLEARSVVESNIVVLLAKKWEEGTLDEKAFKKTFKITEEMKGIVTDDGQVEEFYGLGLGFHKALAEASDNEVLSEMIGYLVEATSHPLWSLINKKILESREARVEQIREHELVLDAIQRGNGEVASRAMRHHIEELAELVLQ